MSQNTQIQIIEQNAENAFLALDQPLGGPLKQSVLHCQFSRIKIVPKPATLLPVLTDALAVEETAVYFCYDGDVIIVWKGFRNHVLQGLTSMLSMLFKDKLPDSLRDRIFHFYEPYQDKEELRAICRGKLVQRDVEKSRTPETQTQSLPIKKVPKVELALTNEQKTSLQEALQSRPLRKSSEVLIVEDNPYLRDLLVCMLSPYYRCREASSANEALQLYVTYAADICFVDLYLSDASGHSVTKLIKQHDPQCAVIMMSDNVNAADVQAARDNGANGYLAKPFSKNKVFETLTACKKYDHTTAQKKITETKKV